MIQIVLDDLSRGTKESGVPNNEILIVSCFCEVCYNLINCNIISIPLRIPLRSVFLAHILCTSSGCVLSSSSSSCILCSTSGSCILYSSSGSCVGSISSCLIACLKSSTSSSYSTSSGSLPCSLICCSSISCIFSCSPSSSSSILCTSLTSGGISSILFLSCCIGNVGC